MAYCLQCPFYHIEYTKCLIFSLYFNLIICLSVIIILMKENRIALKRYAILLFIASILLPINYAYSLGFLLGSLSFILNYCFIHYRYSVMVNCSRSLIILFSLMGIMILAITLLISFILPNIFNYWFVFLALLLNRYLLIYKELKCAR